MTYILTYTATRGDNIKSNILRSYAIKSLLTLIAIINYEIQNFTFFFHNLIRTYVKSHKYGAISYNTASFDTRLVRINLIFD